MDLGHKGLWSTQAAVSRNFEASSGSCMNLRLGSNIYIHDSKLTPHDHLLHLNLWTSEKKCVPFFNFGWIDRICPLNHSHQHKPLEMGKVYVYIYIYYYYITAFMYTCSYHQKFSKHHTSLIESCCSPGYFCSIFLVEEGGYLNDQLDLPSSLVPWWLTATLLKLQIFQLLL